MIVGGAAIGRTIYKAGSKALGAEMAGAELPGYLTRKFGDKIAPILAGAAGEGTRLTGVAGLADVSATIAADFKKKIGVSAGVYAVESIDATNILLAGIKAGKTDRKSLNAFVTAYKGKGLAGTSLAFDKHGDISEGGFAGFLVTGGKLVNKGAVK
jgi:branched-chain amino acid transport system substrate-binding protein